MSYNPTPLTWRDGLNAVAVVMASLAVILIYGTASRQKREVPTHEEMTIGNDPSYVDMTNAVTMNELGPEVFADNFDAVPGDDLDEAIERLIEVENPGRDVNAVGDKHLRQKAYGLLQIRQPYLDDVNKIADTNYTIEDMKNPELARWATRVYLNYYGDVYQSKTGDAPTLEVYARIHNGGPNGWQKASTNDYVQKLNGSSK
jgi:hypothetical protein